MSDLNLADKHWLNAREPQSAVKEPLLSVLGERASGLVRHFSEFRASADCS